MGQGKWRWWLLCGVWCGCFGGPISDLPHSENENRAPGGGANTPDPARGDNGAEAPDKPEPTTPPPASGGDPDLSDGDGLSGGDAGAGSEFPGAGPADSGAPDCDYVSQDGSEACGGAYCGLSAAELEAQIMPGGACATDKAELGLVCDNTLSVTVNGCFQEALGMGNFTAAQVDGCALDAPALQAASADCVGCYLEETRCALTHCLVYCLSGIGEADCKSCRETHCGEAFRTCSGLPAP